MDEIAKLRELLAKATPGPYDPELFADLWPKAVATLLDRGAGIEVLASLIDKEAQATGRLLASAVNALPNLLDTIERLQAERDKAVEAFRVAMDHYERNICHHESTHRGGFLWTICDDCGAKWADDEGGFRPFEYPPEIEAARATIQSIEAGQ